MTTASRCLLVGPFYLCVLLVTTLAAFTSSLAAVPQLIDILIVEIAGRSGHQGFFPIQGLPIQGTTAIARVRLNGNATNVALKVRDSAGNLLSQITMLVPPTGTVVDGTYFAEFTVPNVPFSLTASGIDSSGTQFEVPAANARVPLSPQTLDVRLIPTVSELFPGLPVLFSVQVTNHGGADTITVSLTSDTGGTTDPVTTQISLSAGETKGVNFTFTPPTTASTLVTITVNATASGTNQSGSRNQASFDFVVSSVAQAPLVAWSKPNKSIGANDRDPTFIWICNNNVSIRSISLAYDLAPNTIKTVTRQDEQFENGNDGSDPNRNSCIASSFIKLSFDTVQLRSILATNVFPTQVKDIGQLINVPITAYVTDGSRLAGYILLILKLPPPRN